MHCHRVSAVVALLLLLTSPPLFAQEIVYPERANVVDVTKGPFFAKGDGVHDDTRALVAAVTYAKKHNRIVYFPNGTYLVHDTIVNSPNNPAELKGHQGGEQNKYIRYHGQSRDGVVIRLADHAPGYGTGKKKAVLATIHEGRWSNIGFNNEVTNLTVDVGRGNPGAVGLRFNGSNTAAVRNVRITSPTGEGATGLELIQHGPALVTDVHVEGFDIGIFAENPCSNWVLERIHLERQNELGLLNDQAPTTIRKLTSVNAVPAVRNQREGQLILIEASLSGGGSEAPAVENVAFSGRRSFLLVRDLTTSGYGLSIVDDGRTIGDTEISEYSSHATATLFDSPPPTLALPVLETPATPWDPVEQWACVDEFGAVGDGKQDDTAALQRAMDSGASTVYALTGKKYLLTDTITIRGTVRRVNFMWAQFRIGGKLDRPTTPLFRVVDGDWPTVWIEKAHISAQDGYKSNFPFVEQATQRTLVLADLHIHRGRGYVNTVPGGRVFIENFKGKPRHAAGDPTSFEFNGQQVWARQLNPDGGRHVINRGGLLWVLGFKTENSPTRFTTTDGGLSEILGGCAWTGSDDENGYANEPAIVNRESHVSASFMESCVRGTACKPIAIAVEETRDGVTRTLTADTFPRKALRDGLVVPLYRGYHRQDVDARLQALKLPSSSRAE
ncbi:MAG: glycosyl hydrolase family 28-related protein [Planctomycetota bacterium]